MSSIISELVQLSQDLGHASRHLAILGEGNTSAKLSTDTFAVKASGSSLETLIETDLTECKFSTLLNLLDSPDTSDERVEKTLSEARVKTDGKKPSTEAFFHGMLLQIPDVNFVGHTHPVSVNRVLCSPRAEEFATKRLFPDEIVCCGPASVFVPYVDPGIALSRAIRDRVQEFMQKHQRTPKVILLKNHGLVALGRTAAAVKATTLMADKAARIFFGATAMGGPVFLSDEDVRRIDTRLDEAYRQRVLKL